MRGKLIVIEGTDCSGKETQTQLLIERLRKVGMKIEAMAFPMYETPTGRIIGGPYLGKTEMGPGWFPETAAKVDPKVAALYYAADRKYNIGRIEALLEQGTHVLLDRYVYSNMAHQGGKIIDTNERMNMYAWLDILEFKLLELPKPDIAIFLSMPVEQSLALKRNRRETDELENSIDHLRQANNAYHELASVYKWKTIDCVDNGALLSILQIQEKVYSYVYEQLVKDPV